MLILGKLFIQVVNLLIFRSLPLPRCIWSRQVCCQNGKIAWNYWWRTLCSLSDDVRLCQRRNQEISQEIITFSVSHLLEHLKLLEDYSFYRNWGTVPRLLRSQMDVNWQIMSFFMEYSLQRILWQFSSWTCTSKLFFSVVCSNYYG